MRRLPILTILVMLTMLLGPHLATLDASEQSKSTSGRSTACSGTTCLTELFVNARGSETDAVGPADWRTGEWVEIHNSGSSAVDMTGWYLHDHYGSSNRQLDISISSSPQTVVWPQNPQNLMIAAGDYMVVARNGDGQSCGFCMTNSQGVVELYNSAGVLQHEATWNTYVNQDKSLIPGATGTADWVEDTSISPGAASGSGNGTGGPAWNVSDLQISELMPDSWPSADNSTYPGGEWLEIENTGSVAIDLTNWSVEDASGNSVLVNETHLIDHATSTMIQPNERRVIAVNGAATYGMFNNAGGDSARLKNPAGEFVSAANYTGPAKVGHSYIPPTLGSGNWQTSLFPTPAAANAVNINGSSDVRINEIMVNATNSWLSYPNGEWIELAHLGGDPSIDLTDWAVISGTGQTVDVDDSIVDRDSGSGTLIDAGTFVVLGVPITTAQMLVSGDTISLIDSAGTIVDSVSWSTDPGTNKTVVPLDAALSGQSLEVSGWATPAGPNPNQISGSVDENAEFRISEVMANPSGSDTNTHPEGEWVEIVNVGNDTASFQNWKLKDGRGVSLTIDSNSIPNMNESDPAAWELDVGEHLVIWRNGRSMNLQNGGDTLSLVDQDGAVVQLLTWSLTPLNGTLVQGLTAESDWVPSPWPTPGSENPAFALPYDGSIDLEISEVMPQCTSGSQAIDGDWLEVHNVGSQPLNLSRWVVANDGGDVLVIREQYLIHFDSDSQLPVTRADWGTLGADEYVVVKPENNGFLSNFNEMIELRDPNLNVRQEVRWTTSENCDSIEGEASAWSEDWIPTMWPTPGLENPVPTPWDPSDPVLFTRIMPGQVYNRDNEFIEITNLGDSIVHMAGWQLVRTKVDGSSNNGTFNQLMLGPGESLIMTQEPENLLADGGIEARDMDDILDYSPSLYDSGSSLQLITPDGTVVDSVVYTGGLTSVEGWSGPAISSPPATFQGLIFMRGDGCSTQPDTNTSADWEIRWLRLGASLFCDSGVFSASGSLTPMISPDGSLYQFINWLDSAENNVHIHVYELMSNDIVEKLKELARADVQVTVIVEEDPLEDGDDLYKIRGMAYELYAAGVNVNWMGTPKGEDAPPAPYQYIHSKVAVKDDNSVWIGSGNLKESTFPAGQDASNRDWGLIIDSDDVAQLVLTRMLWDENTSHPQLIPYSVVDSQTGKPSGWIGSGPSGQDPVAPSVAVPVVTGEFTGQVFTCPDDCVNGIVDLLDSAETSIDLSLQGFDLGWTWGWGTNPLYDAIERALVRGVQVRLVLNAAYVWTDPDIQNMVDHFNNQWNRTDGYDSVAILMATDERITKLHNKGVIVDGESVLISSINWNSNAILRNREMGIVIHNEELASWYLASFESDFYRLDAATDTDGDNMPDIWEVANGLNRTSSVVPNSQIPEQSHDFDQDGLDNLREMNVGGNPLSADTDNDCIPDMQELVFAALNAVPEADAMTKVDADGNGVADGEETECGATLAGGEEPNGEGEEPTEEEPGPSLPKGESPLDSTAAKVLLGVIGIAALALLVALVAMLVFGRENAQDVITDETFDLAEALAQETAFDTEAESTIEETSAPVLDAAPTDEPVVVTSRDDAVGKHDGVFGAPQLDGFQFEGWTEKQVQDALDAGWTIEQLQEHYNQNN